MKEQTTNAADRAFELLEQNTPHQLAMEVVGLRGAILSWQAEYKELVGQHDQLTAQLADATQQCAVMAGLLRSAKSALDYQEVRARGAGFAANYNTENVIDRIDAALAGKVLGPAPHQNLLDWAVTSWHEQVANRPMENVYRRTLDSVWRQVIRFAGEDPQSIIGPSHDDLLHTEQKPEGGEV